MSELNQKEVNEQMYLFVKRWLDDLPFEESKKVPVMAIGYCIARLSKQDELLKEQEAKIEQLNRFVNGFSRDAIPVVRCKDCKYWSAERINDFNKCRRWINVGVKNFATMGDWFCADGERK